VREIFLERKMLKILFKDAIKSPGKLLALCLVLYLATVSFFVAGFLVLLAARWIQKSMQQKARAIEAAEAEAEAARIEAEKLAAAARASQAAAAAAKETVVVAPVASATGPAANDPNATRSTAVPQYARSAVVIPFRTGTQ
jgi:Zn-dependent protease with chaperone function